MAKVNWREILGWTYDQLEELRFSGFSFLREGKYDKALIFFKALLIIDPKSAYDAQTLGAIYLQMNDAPQALPALDFALSLDPTHEPTLLNKVKALLMMSKKDEAMSIALQLSNSGDLTISGDASALIMAYT